MSSRCRRSAGPRRAAFVLIAVLAAAVSVRAQGVSQRGFLEASGWGFFQPAPNDEARAIGDVLLREEIFVAPTAWLRVAAGGDLRASSHDQVEESWRLDFGDRGVRRPRAAVRRLSATVSRGPLVVDMGKQFIRWGRADLVNPTDHFAPRDFLNVVDNEFLAVTAVHATLTRGGEAVEAVWQPRFTPSRMPLLDQRWTVLPTAAHGFALVDGGAELPKRSQVGVRWNHVGDRFEASASYFDGFNHLPNVDAGVIGPETIAVARRYPPVRGYGGDVAVPTRWITLKGEAAYYTSTSAVTDEYVLYVLQLERQTGEWTLVGGYAGEVDTATRSALTFAPDRGLTRSVLGRAAYTIDANRSLAVEGAVRQSGDGAYARAEYSHAHGQHWRATVSAAAIRGAPGDFLGQFRLNSHVVARLRWSF